MKKLNGKIVFITGAARGIGYSIAETFAKEGANIIIADVIKDLAKESAKKIEEDYHVKASAYEMDVNNCASIEKVFSEVEKEYGSLDVMVNNAGVQIRNPSKIFKEKDWDLLMGVNLKGVFFCCQAAANLMKNGGAIVNISSGTSTQTTPARAPYVISKAGVNALTAVLGAEWAAEGIRVNAVAPGWIMTQMVQDGIKLGVVSEKQILATVPFKRLANPTEIADAVVYLASAEASYVTGQTLFVDGGWSVLGMPDID